MIPFTPELFGYPIPVHLILEYLAFLVAFQYYRYLRKRITDRISDGNRLSIILGAIVGALIGSRLVGYLENPVSLHAASQWVALMNTKTIMGGLFGGLVGVEISKLLIGEQRSSGDLFTLPLILGIFIGRIGCFLSGINEFTYGTPTTFFMGMDLGDGLKRHPVALYEMLFLLLLFGYLYKLLKAPQLPNGMVFKIFMIAYFGFRFGIEFIKPNVFFIGGLSSIQWLCVICWLYYLIVLGKRRSKNKHHTYAR